MNKRQQGKLAEGIVAEYYLSQGRKLIARNYTVRGGEIDIIMENETHRVYCEVKSINYVDDMFDYVTSTKKYVLKRTIEKFVYQYPTQKQERIDVVFVRQNHIVSSFENISLT